MVRHAPDIRAEPADLIVFLLFVLLLSAEYLKNCASAGWRDDLSAGPRGGGVIFPLFLRATIGRFAALLAPILASKY